MPKKLYNYPNDKDFWRYYNNNHGQSKKIHNLKFSKVLKSLNNKILREMLEQGYEWKMPYGLGLMRIIQYRQTNLLDENGDLRTNKMKVNWPETKKWWLKESKLKSLSEVYSKTTKEWRKQFLVFHDNIKTDGIVYSLKWSKYLAYLSNRGYYTCDTVAEARNKINEYVTSNEGVEYIDTTNNIYV